MRCDFLLFFCFIICGFFRLCSNAQLNKWKKKWNATHEHIKVYLSIFFEFHLLTSFFVCVTYLWFFVIFCFIIGDFFVSVQMHNSTIGARIGLAEEVRQRIQIAWLQNDPLKGVHYLYLSEKDYHSLSDVIRATRIVLPPLPPPPSSSSSSSSLSLTAKVTSQASSSSLSFSTQTQTMTMATSVRSGECEGEVR